MQMEWVNVSDKLPPFFPLEGDQKITSQYVWVTDGKLIEIAHYIFRPRNYGCAVDDEDEKATCGCQPHWHLERETQSFIDGDKCFGFIETSEITHWMSLPKPPKE
jgi:hypothetical protein